MMVDINRLPYGVIILNKNLEVIEKNQNLKLYIDNIDVNSNFSIGDISEKLFEIVRSFIEKNDTEFEDFIFILDNGRTLKAGINRLDNDNFIINVCDITYEDKIFDPALISNRIDVIKNITELISVEYNNNLTAILGFASFAKNNLHKDSDLYKYFNIIENSANNAIYLTNQLLTFAGIDYFRQKYINLNKLIQNNVDLFSKVLPDNIKIQTILSPDDIIIFWDENQINQLLINLIINSKESIEEKKSIGNILVETILDGDFIYIKVKDDGVGISKENLDKIFKINFTTKDLKTHKGIGLAVVDGIVKNMKGKININSEIGYGTEIEIVLPNLHNKKKQNEQKGEISGKNEKILIIDDKQAIRSLVSILLKEKNYIPFVAGDNREVFRILDSEKIDLIILDIMMPEIRGDELYFKIKEKYSEIPVVILTGTINDKNIFDFINENKLDYILKPFKNSDFYDVINRNLNKM